MATQNVGALGALLAAPELLKWSESLTRSTASLFDRALDAKYLRSRVGGGWHRSFDGGHDLWGAWACVKSASEHDSLAWEVAGYVGALWKDATTSRGLPFVTWDRAAFDWCAERLGSVGVGKTWLYDAVSYDVFEVFSAGLGTVGLVLALKNEDSTRLGELLGSLSVIAVISANPILGSSVVVASGRALWGAKSCDEKTIDVTSALRGAALAATSAAIFSALAAPVLVKFAVAVIVTGLSRRLSRWGAPSVFTIGNALRVRWALSLRASSIQ